MNQAKRSNLDQRCCRDKITRYECAFAWRECEHTQTEWYPDDLGCEEGEWQCLDCGCVKQKAYRPFLETWVGGTGTALGR